MQRLLVPVLTSTGLIGGYGLARATGARWAGGVVLAAVGTAVAVAVGRRGGAWRAMTVTTVYVLAFGASHPLAKCLGAWPAVLAVTAATAIPAAALADRP